MVSVPSLRDRCERIRELLPGYIEGELTAVEARQVAGHLDCCAACRGEQVRFSRSLAVLGSAVARHAPSDLRAGLAARIGRERTPPAARARQWRLAAAGSAAIFVAGAGAARLTVLRSDVAHPVRVVRGPVPAAPVVASGAAKPEPRVAGDIGPGRAQADTPPSGVADGAARTSERIGVSPVPAAPTPNRRLLGAIRVARTPPTSFGSFLDVRDRSGRSAREMLAGMDRAASSSSGTPSGDTVIASVPQALPRAHAAVLTVRRLDERVRVGDTVTRVSGDAALDSNGELAAIRVTAETVAPPSGSPWSGAER